MLNLFKINGFDIKKITDKDLNELCNVIKIYEFDNTHNSVKMFWNMIYDVLPNMQRLITLVNNIEFSIRHVENTHKLINCYRKSYNNDWLNIIIFIKKNMHIFNKENVMSAAIKVFDDIRYHKKYLQLFK